jgi:hypothetical protein
LLALGYILYYAYKDLGFEKWTLNYIKISIALICLTQILLPLSKMVLGELSLFYPHFLALFIICVTQLVLLITNYYSVLYYSLKNNSLADSFFLKDQDINSQDIAEIVNIEIGYNNENKLFYLTIIFKDQFQKQFKETNENSKLLQPLLYWLLFSVAKKQNVMLTHQDVALAKYRMVDYWNKGSNFKLTQELLFFNESGYFEFKINEENITLCEKDFYKSKLSVIEIFKKYFICFVPQDVKTTEQLNNKKNADKYLLDNFETFYKNIL